MTNPGFNGMWLPPDQDPRAETGPVRGERDTLIGYLEVYRTTFELKCQGLTPSQLGTRSVPPSNISLLGLVRHLARVEQSWFRRAIQEDMNLPRLFQDPDLDAGFSWSGESDEALVAQAWALWREQVSHARTVLDRTDFDTVVSVHGDSMEVRDIIVHLVEEYARHCGHADLVRECVDGRAGQ